MRSVITSLANPARLQRSIYTSSAIPLQALDIIHGQIDAVNVDEFRQNAFIPEKPVLITTKTDTESNSAGIARPNPSIPAAAKWFERVNASESGTSSYTILPSQEYLAPFGRTILPYELVVNTNRGQIKYGSGPRDGVEKGTADLLTQLINGSPDGAFHRFNAPLSLFLQACRWKSGSPQLYIAQAQIADLPKQLQDDLPTPRLVKEVGKGDVYDSNIWMGIPPTYTPLHKDPNPNLFVQLASSKRVRIFRPSIGASIFREVQQSIGQSSSSSFRGEEMMEGPERERLGESVWGQSGVREGFEVIVSPGDALFIPKGWWHSVKSVGRDINASVNWWFR